MFKNTFQSGFLSILYSIGSKPLQIWEKKVSVGIDSKWHTVYLDCTLCWLGFFVFSKTAFNITRSKEIVYFKCSAQPQITKRFYAAEIRLYWVGATAVAKQQVMVIIANKLFVTSFSGIKVFKAVLLPLCVTSTSWVF